MNLRTEALHWRRVPQPLWASEYNFDTCRYSGIVLYITITLSESKGEEKMKALRFAPFFLLMSLPYMMPGDKPGPAHFDLQRTNAGSGTAGH